MSNLKGQGRGKGGSGRGQSGKQGQGMGGRGQGPGSQGTCVCVKCGFEKPHEAGVPCREEKCPECKTVLLRKGGYHYNQSVKKNN